jgi:hypothetical protein
LWSPNGEQLFFSAGSSTPMAIPIRTNPSVAFGTPVELPRGPRTDIRSSDVRGRGYDVLPDGRFVSVSPVFGEGAASGEIRVVLNWFTELQQRVPVK